MGDRSYVALDPRLLNGVHIRRLGMSVYLLAFFIHKQTDAGGTVFYGKPITYRWIREHIPHCPPERTLRMWISILRENGYVELSHDRGGGMRVRVVDSQKWPTAQLGLFDRALSKSCDSEVENLSECGNPLRQDVAGGSGKILPNILNIEKDENGEKRKSAPLETSAPLKTEKLPPFRIIFGNLFERREEKKKIS